jgi:hypothetical protein
MQVQVQRRAEPLEHGDGAAAPVRCFCPLPVEPLDDPESHPEHAAREVGATCQEEASRPGPVSTHWRVATRGSTCSAQCAARSAIRLPPQLGQNPRPLHENGTRR